MKAEDINIVLQEFESIENIIPSERWDFAFEQKLLVARNSKSFKISKISISVLILVFINIGFVLNSLRTDKPPTEISKKADFKTIAEELL